MSRTRGVRHDRGWEPTRLFPRASLEGRKKMLILLSEANLSQTEEHRWLDVDETGVERPRIIALALIRLGLIETKIYLELPNGGNKMAAKITSDGLFALGAGAFTSKELSHSIKLPFPLFKQLSEIAKELNAGSIIGLLEGVANRREMFVRWWRHAYPNRDGNDE